MNPFLFVIKHLQHVRFLVERILIMGRAGLFQTTMTGLTAGGYGGGMSGL